MMEGLWSDLRHGFRVHRRAPLQTAAAILALGLGIGAASALFSVIDATLLRPLDFPSPDELVVIWEQNLEQGHERMYASPPDFGDWAAGTSSFQSLAAFDTRRRALSASGQSFAVQGAEVSPALFSMLGVSAASGRTLSEADRAGPAVALISQRLWQTRFGGDPGIVGRTMDVDGETTEIVGVMRSGFTFPPHLIENLPAHGETDVWTPLRAIAPDSRGSRYLSVVGRLGTGVDISAAERELDELAARLARQYPDTNRGWSTTLVPLHEQLGGQSRGRLLLLFAAVGLLLLVACVNVANILLGRGVERQGELAVRAAIGARKGRLIRQLLTESVALGLAGGFLGLALAWLALGSIVALVPETLLRATEASLDVRTIGFTILAAVSSAALFGTLPAFTASAQGPSARLRDGGGTRTPSRSGRRLQNLLVAGQVALSLTLLVGAGLLFRTFLGLSAVDPGLVTSGTVTASVALPAGRYPDADARTAGYARLLATLRDQPAVRAAGLIYDVPLAHDRQGTQLLLPGEAEPPPGQNRSIGFSIATDGYFGAMGVPLTQGRDFDVRDGPDAERVAIVNQALVDRFLPGGAPAVGRSVTIFGADHRVIGVSGDVRFENLRSAPPPVAYLPYSQQAWPRTMRLVASGGGPPAEVLAAIREGVDRTDPDVPLYDLTTMDSVVDESLASERFSATLLAAFAALALILAAIGIFGVVSHAVSQRRRETGIRIALGAAGGDVQRLVVLGSLRPVLLGLALGVPAAVLASRALRGSLYALSPVDPVTYAAVGGILLTVAALASWVPALRATRVDPAEVLRDD